MAKLGLHIGKQSNILVLDPTVGSEFPARAGAYALLIRLPRPLRTIIGAQGVLDFEPGFYLYLGSANGPGGLRARLRRHLRREKKPHWHIDTLTTQGEIAAILAVPGGSECDLVDRARMLPGVTVPHPGFGSSDCSRCAAHLLAVAGPGASVLAGLRHLTPSGAGAEGWP